MKNPDAHRFDHISYMEVLSQGLHVMDATATSLCMDNDVPMIVFDLTKPGNIKAALQGEPVGTVSSRRLGRRARRSRLSARQRGRAYAAVEKLAADSRRISGGGAPE